MMGMGGCCMEKVVGGVTYLIAEENTGKTAGYGCSEDCVYIRMDETAGQMYCFAPGNLEVVCSSGSPVTAPPTMSPSTSSNSPTTSSNGSSMRRLHFLSSIFVTNHKCCLSMYIYVYLSMFYYYLLIYLCLYFT